MKSVDVQSILMKYECSICGSGDFEFDGVNSIGESVRSDLIWVSPNYSGDLEQVTSLDTGHTVIITSDDYLKLGSALDSKTCIVTKNPKAVMAEIIDKFWKPVSQRALTHLHSFVCDEVTIGKNVEIKAGAVIGLSGHNYYRDASNNWQLFPHIGNVVIEDDVVIGANSCIDRAVMGSTIIRSGTKIDNMVHVGHNCNIGKNNIICAGAIIGGGTKIGNDCWIGLDVNIIDRITIGNNVTIGMGATVLKSIGDNMTVIGNPARQTIGGK